MIRSKGRYLTSVIASGVGRVDFQTSAERLDCNDVLYSGMTVQDSTGKQIRQFSFTYEARGGNRPFLVNVKRVVPGSPLSETTGFIYNPGELPAMHSFSQDFYGYHNGAANATLLPEPESFTLQARFPSATANREPNPAAAAMGMLSKVLYPTGGSDTIIYEGNDFNEYKQILPNRATITVMATGTAFKQTTTVVSAPFTISYEQEAKILISIENINSSTFDPIHDRGTVILRTQSGTEIFSYNDNPGYNSQRIVVVSAGTYVLEARGTGLGIKANMSIVCRPGNSYMDSVNTFTAGVRVKKVITTTHATDAKPQVKKYDYNNPASPLRSSGGAQASPEYLHYFQNRQFCNRGVVSYLYCNYSGMYSSPRIPVLLYEGGASYEAVREILGENGENGAIQHYYHLSPLTFPSQVGMGQGSYVGAPMSNTGTFNGKEKQTLVYKKDGASLSLIKKTDYSYKSDSRGFQIIEATAVNKKFSNDIVNSFLSAVDFEGFDVARYSNIATWVYLDTLRETVYETGQTPMQTVAIYQYENASHKQLSRSFTTLSNGKVQEQVSRYPQDYTGITGTDLLSASVKNLQTKGLIAVPVETMTYISDANGSNRGLVGARLAIYNSPALTAKEVWQTEHNYPLTDFSPMSIVAGVAVKDSRYKKQISFDAYDNSGNILQQQLTNNVVKSYLWGYNQTYPIAEVVNAASNEIFFDSFEEQNGWGTSGLTYDQSKSHTGRVSAKITASSSGEVTNHANKWLNVSLSAPKKFRYSGWIYSDAPTAEIYLFMKTATETGYFTLVDLVATSVTGKWVYLEKEYTVPSNITQLNIRIDNNGGGNVWFDDIRLYPAASQMTSYTYDPLIGATSLTDVNNRTSYYEYDAFGRLFIVRDNDRNIAKKICYNYQGQVDNCSFNVFFNVAASRSITRNNCGTNGTGATVLYQVPAGKYTSYVSQADADQQAVNELDNAQSSVNASAGCTWVNQAQSGTFTRNNCGTDYTGSTVTYTIAANTYSSTISLADANQQAINAVNAGGQAYANANGTCTLTCNTGNCSGSNKKCINNTCQTGIKVYTFCEHVTGSVYRHYYHYEWSDGSWSQDYQELNSNVCEIE